RSTHSRQRRERSGKQNNRAVELSRLIGRALRPAIDLENLGSNTLRIDCDVIQADGGTRCASIIGAWIALKDAENWLINEGIVDSKIIKNKVAAVSVGILNDIPILDLNYEEDSSVNVDLNIIMNEKGRFIEIQGTAEHEPFSRKELENMLNLAENGMKKIFELEENAISSN
ncbi:MAG: ribonuclease PH, partial [Promethearchaeota archaeon]